MERHLVLYSIITLQGQIGGMCCSLAQNLKKALSLSKHISFYTILNENETIATSLKFINIVIGHTVLLY